MRDPAVLAARHHSPPACSTTGWALSLLPPLYSLRTERARPTPGWSQIISFDPAVLARLEQSGISSRVEDYGGNWSRFESELADRDLKGPARHPLVSVPSIAEIDWTTGSLQVRPQTFLVAYEGATPVFLTRASRSRTIARINLKQLRLLHRTWQRWPVVLPSMFLTVLWHWPHSD